MIVNIKKRYACIIIGLLVLAVGVFVVYALAPSIDTSQGYHESNQISVSVSGVEKTLQEAIDDGSIGGIIGSTNVRDIILSVPDCDGENQALGWDGERFICQAISGGGSGGTELDLVYGIHSSAQCTNLGGTVVTDGSDKFCRFNQGSCKTGWTPFKSWSTTSSNSATCTPYFLNFDMNYIRSCNKPFGVGLITCNTGSHQFSNLPRESCQAEYNRHGPDSYCSASCTGNNYVTTYASITQRGCY